MNAGPRRFLLTLCLSSLLQPVVNGANRLAPSADEMHRNRFTHITRLDLEDDHGQLAGKVKDFVLDQRSGTVRFGVVAIGGTLGLGRTYKVVPARTLNSNTSKRSALGLSVSRFTLAQAFDFKRRDLASLQQPIRARQLDVIFGLVHPLQNSTIAPPAMNQSSLEPAKPGPERKAGNASGNHLELASELIGDLVFNRKQQRLGKVSDLLIDPSGRRTSVAIISAGHELRHGKLYAVSLRRLAAMDEKRLSIDAEIVAFINAQTFDLRVWENGTLPDTVFEYAERAPDHTIIRDRTNAEPVLSQLSESTSDVRLAQQIRHEITNAPDLSFTARNVQIITIAGQVTLRGPVLTTGEKDRLVEIARRVAGADAIKEELEIRK